MKKLTLDQTWEQCLAMWKWVSRQCLGKSVQWCEKEVDDLKDKWLEENGLQNCHISQDCFFCDYTTPKGQDGFDCFRCPGKKVDSSFTCLNCPDFECDCGAFFASHPRKFYAKLKELNKIRLAKKQKTK